MASETGKGAVAAAKEIHPRGARFIAGIPKQESDEKMIQELAELIQRLAVEPAVAERDVEWCKMLGYPEAGAVGNTPEFMQRELDAMEDVDAADHVRCRNRLATAEELSGIAVEAEREVSLLNERCNAKLAAAKEEIRVLLDNCKDAEAIRLELETYHQAAKFSGPEGEARVRLAAAEAERVTAQRYGDTAESARVQAVARLEQVEAREARLREALSRIGNRGTSIDPDAARLQNIARAAFLKSEESKNE